MATTPPADCGGCTSAAELERLEEEAIVSLIRCRLEALRRAGCDTPECLVLAGRVDVRLDRAADLIARGCPPDVALRILV